MMNVKNYCITDKYYVTINFTLVYDYHWPNLQSVDSTLNWGTSVSHCIFFYRSVKGYTGIGLDYCEQFDEIQNSIVAEYGTEADIDWPIVHNAG